MARWPLLWLDWRRGEPRREALAAVQRLQDNLASRDPATLADLLILPAALQGRTAAEQSEFTRKALADELSPEGLAVLEREGRFGSLKELFPAEADGWARQAGVAPDECVAFRLDRPNGLRAEVVLVRQASAQPPASSRRYCVLRCNNVRPNPQPAPPPASPVP